MIRLNMKSAPVWLDLGGGVRVQLRPASTSLMMEARKDPELRDLDRDFGREKFGDAGYAREELVAELGAAFLCADLGIALGSGPIDFRWVA